MFTTKNSHNGSALTSNTCFTFKWILGRIQEYLRKKEKEQNTWVMSAGDFNFPSTVDKWVNSDEAVATKSKATKLTRKSSFSLLQQLNMI